MKRLFALPALAVLATGSLAFATLAPADQSATSMPSTTSSTATTTREAQDSANGSMTNADLTGNVNDDSSALSRGTTSGTTSGAIIDHTTVSKKKVHKKKKKHTGSEAPAAPVDDTTSNMSGNYGSETLNAPTTTEGKTQNDEIMHDRKNDSGLDKASGSSPKSHSSGGDDL